MSLGPGSYLSIHLVSGLVFLDEGLQLSLERTLTAQHSLSGCGDEDKGAR